MYFYLYAPIFLNTFNTLEAILNKIIEWITKNGACVCVCLLVPVNILKHVTRIKSKVIAIITACVPHKTTTELQYYKPCVKKTISLTRTFGVFCAVYHIKNTLKFRHIDLHLWVHQLMQTMIGIISIDVRMHSAYQNISSG